MRSAITLSNRALQSPLPASTSRQNAISCAPNGMMVLIVVQSTPSADEHGKQTPCHRTLHGTLASHSRWTNLSTGELRPRASRALTK